VKPPERLEPLIADGIIDAVRRPLQSGKEADVFVVDCGGETCCAKVYKAATERSFQSRAEYAEGRQHGNSRRARAVAKGTRYGKRVDEDAWQRTEVDALYRLAEAGVRAPMPYQFADGVLVMELVTDGAGEAAPRMDGLSITPEQARDWHDRLIREVVRMLCAGLIHGDLSPYNILVDEHGPVIIDFPQVVDAAGNNNACRMLVRDVDNLTAFFARAAPELASLDYAREIWALYEAAELTPNTPLTGQYEPPSHTPDVYAVLGEIKAAREEAEGRLPSDEVEDDDDEEDEEDW
jgi:RIO kinase 1